MKTEEIISSIEERMREIQNPIIYEIWHVGCAPYQSVTARYLRKGLNPTVIPHECYDHKRESPSEVIKGLSEKGCLHDPRYDIGGSPFVYLALES